MWAISTYAYLFGLESGLVVGNRVKEGVFSLLMTVVLEGVVVLVISNYLRLRALERQRTEVVVGDENV